MIIVLIILMPIMNALAQKKTIINNSANNNAQNNASTFNNSVTNNTINSKPTTLAGESLFAALNYNYEIKPPIVNNNASLSISYSAFVVGLDHQRIKSAANWYIDFLQIGKIAIPKNLLDFANMRYKYHKDFSPMDGTFNVTFIRPNLNLNPQNVAVIPSNKISGQIKYRISQ
jgi:hypothetical protein